jgi:hypothetical protein
VKLIPACDDGIEALFILLLGEVSGLYKAGGCALLPTFIAASRFAKEHCALF